MKVLHVTQNYEPSKGGTQHTMKKVSDYLVRNYQDEVIVLTTNSYFAPNRKKFKRIKPGEEIIDGVTVKRYSFIRIHQPFIRTINRIALRFFKMRLPEVFSNLNMGPLAPALFRAMRSPDVDVISVSSIPYLFADYPLWKNPLKKPFVLYGAIHIHHKELSKRYLKRIHACDYYIANTAFEKEFLKNLGVDGDKIEVIGTATDVYTFSKEIGNEDELRKKYSVKNSNSVVLFIGRQDASKGIEVLLSASRKLRENGCNVDTIIAGAEGSYSEALKKKSRENNYLIVRCDISEKEKCELLKIADVLVLPSKEESFGVVFLEGWSFKKPVIGANIGAVASVISEGIDGYLFQPDNANDLAEKIEVLIKDELLRKSLGEEGYKKVMENYTWDVIGEKFREVYLAAIEKHKLKNDKNNGERK